MKCDFDAGKALFLSEKYDEAFKKLMPCAENGDSEAQADIGVMFQLGLGVERNVQSAIMWLTLAAEGGRGDAAHNLGTIYLTSEPELQRDEQKSKFWFEKAKSLGFVVGSEDWYRRP